MIDHEITKNVLSKYYNVLIIVMANSYTILFKYTIISKV